MSTRILALGTSPALVDRLSSWPEISLVAVSAQDVADGRFDAEVSLEVAALPDLIVLGDQLSESTAASLADRLGIVHPSTSVVRVDASLATDGTDEELARVLAAAELRQPASEPPGEVATSVVSTIAPASPVPDVSTVVTVISPKGGVGKTSIATNLAIGLAEQHPMQVVLVDLDLQFGDVAAVLDLDPTSTMVDALSPASSADTLVLKTHLTLHSASFHVLAGSESPADAEDVRGADVVRLLEQLRSQFAFVVVDTAAGLDEPTLAALEVSDHAVVVSTMDVSCVRSIRREVDVLKELHLLPPGRTLTLNMADRQSGMRVKDVEAAVGLPVELVIPRSSDVQLASNQGSPLMLKGRRRGGPFVRAIGAMLQRLEQSRSGQARTASKHRRLDVA